MVTTLSSLPLWLTENIWRHLIDQSKKTKMETFPLLGQATSLYSHWSDTSLEHFTLMKHNDDFGFALKGQPVEKRSIVWLTLRQNSVDCHGTGHSIEKLRQINKKLNHHFWFISLKTGSVEAFRFEDHDDYEHEISHFITHFIITIINKLHLHTESISARK